MRSDSVKNVSAYADQNHAPSLAAARLNSYHSENFVLYFLKKLCLGCPSIFYELRNGEKIMSLEKNLTYIGEQLKSLTAIASPTGFTKGNRVPLRTVSEDGV